MPLTRKRKQEQKEGEQAQKKRPSQTFLFDSDDDALFMSQALNAAQPQPQVAPTQIIEDVVSPTQPPPQNAKRPPPPPPSVQPTDRPATSSDIDKMLAVLSGRFDDVRSDIATVNSKVDQNAGGLVSLRTEVQTDRAEVKQAVQEMNHRIDTLAAQIDGDNLGEAIRDAVSDQLSEFGINYRENLASVQSSTKDEEYLACRRSLHLWPLQSADIASLLTYSKTFLQLSEEDFKKFTITSISPCRQTKIESEFSVQFATIADRDAFRAFAPRLHNFQRTAGMRLAFPDHLVHTFKLLENEGFRIVRHRPGTKRSIKYDDRARSLVMDVKLPGAAWVRISPDQVVQATRSRKTLPTPAVSEILAISSQDLPDLPEAAQGSDDEMDESAAGRPRE